MKKLPLRARRLMRKHRRTVAHVGLREAQGWAVPVFFDRLLNRAIWTYAERVLRSKTFRSKPVPDGEDDDLQ